MLRFDKGEEIFAGLIKVMRDQNINSCFFQAIGSCGEVELGFYNKFLKDYRHKPFVEDLEIISLSGNGCLGEDGSPVIHAHGVFGRNDFSVFGGHVFKLIAEATCEFFLIKLEGQMSRKLNSEWNLKLLI